MLKRKNKNWIIELVLIIILLALPLLASQISITGLVSFSILPEEQTIQESSEEQFTIQPIENIEIKKNETFEIPFENESFNKMDFILMTWYNQTNGFSVIDIGLDNPYSITTNGSDFWILDDDDYFIYHVNRSGYNFTDGFNLNNIGAEFPSSITTNGSDFWIIDNDDSFVYHIDRYSNNITDGFDPTNCNSGSHNSITTNGSDFWITTISGFPSTIGFVCHYDKYGNNITDGFNSNTIGSNSPHGITTNGSDFWIIDTNDNFVYHINRSYNNITDGFSATLCGSNVYYDITTNTTNSEAIDFWLTGYSSGFICLISNSHPQPNSIPTINLIYITSDNNKKNTTIVNLTGTFSVTDSEGDLMVLNETRWYNNSIEESGLRNFTLVLADNTTRFEKWMFSARTYDGYDWSIWTNSSNFTILNDLPNITFAYIISDDDTKNNTLVNLTGTFSVTDSEGDLMVLNETRWYNNSIEVTGLRNFTLVLAGNTTVLDKWRFSARTYDGYDWSIWTNSSNFTILRSCLCSSCYECIIELNSSTCSTVNLTSDILNQVGTCINNPTNFSNKIFDCQGYTIDGDDSGTDYGILLTQKQNNTIRNCILTDFYNNINLTLSKNNTIIDNTANSSYNYGYSIYIYKSNYTTTKSNTADSNTYPGFYIEKSYYNIITNNTFSLNNGGGISTSHSFYNNFTNNTVSNSSIGLFIYHGGNNIFINNTFKYNTRAGFWPYKTRNNSFADNKIIKTEDQYGFRYGDFNNVLDVKNNITTTNTINDLPINLYDGFYRACPNNQVININSNYSWFGLGDCSNVTVIADKNHSLDLLLFAYTTNSKVSNINVTCGGACTDKLGAFLIHASNITIENSTFNSNWRGIFLSDSSQNNTIANNTISMSRGFILPNGAGITLYSDTDNNIIRDNIIDLNDYGVYILDSTCNKNVFTNNIIISNLQYGIYSLSSSNNLTNNTIQNNTVWDFYSTGNSTNNTIINLTLYQNLISFTSKDIALKGLQLSESPTNPPGYLSINQWINVTNNSANSWVYLNFLYSDSDIGNIDESSLKIWEYNGTNWNESGFYTVSVLDIDNNVIGANITNFSIFAPFGTVLPGPTGGPSHVYPREEIPEKNITKPEGKKSEIPKKKEEKPFIFEESPTKIQTNLKEYIPLSVAIILIILFFIYYFKPLKKHKINKTKKLRKKHAIRRMYRKKKKYKKIF